MLDVNAAILVDNRAYVILTDHHLRVGDSISLCSTGCRCQILVDVVFVADTLALVVGHDPLHVLLAEVSNDTIRVQDLTVAVVKLADHGTVAGDETVHFARALLAIRAKFSVTHLHDLAGAEELQDETILDGQGCH